MALPMSRQSSSRSAHIPTTWMDHVALTSPLRSTSGDTAGFPKGTWHVCRMKMYTLARADTATSLMKAEPLGANIRLSMARTHS